MFYLLEIILKHNICITTGYINIYIHLNMHIYIVIYMHMHIYIYRLSWCFSGKEYDCSGGAAGDVGLIPGWEDPLERKRQASPVFLPG